MPDFRFLSKKPLIFESSNGVLFLSKIDLKLDRRNLRISVQAAGPYKFPCSVIYPSHNILLLF